MKCPDCDGKSYVVKTERTEESRLGDVDVKKRRRVCRNCYGAFYTFEVYSKNYKDLTRLSESNTQGLKRGKLKSRQSDGTR